MPKVSIAIPTYEPDRAHLREAVESVLAQSEQDWELLIHDDASKADVKTILAPFLDDPRIRFERSSKRLGIGGNWNACQRFGTAPYLQYLFQDDRWEPEYLARALAKAEDGQVGLVATHHRYVFEGPIETERKIAYTDLEALRLSMFTSERANGHAFLRQWVERGLHPNLIGEPSFVLLRRSVTDAVGPFREDMPQNLDVEYWLRCLVRADAAFVRENGGAFRVHPEAASARNFRDGSGLFDRVGLFASLLARLPAGELRRATTQSIVDQFAAMTAKFFRRRHEGNASVGRGKGILVRAVLGHPILVMKGMVRYFQGK